MNSKEKLEYILNTGQNVLKDQPRRVLIEDSVKNHVSRKVKKFKLFGPDFRRSHIHIAFY